MLHQPVPARSDVQRGTPWLDDMLAGFSGPHTPFAEAEAAFIVVSHTEMLVEAFLQREGDALAATSDDLVAFLTDALASGFDFEACWHWSGGALHAFMVGAQGGAAVPLAAAFALNLCCRGTSGRWAVTFETPTPFVIGPTALPAVQRIAVDAGPEGVEVTADGQSWRLQFGQNGVPRLAAGPIALSLIAPTHVAPDNAARLLHADAYSFAPGAAQLPQPWVAACGEALSLLAEASPLYAAWVGRVAKMLLPMPLIPGTLNSGCERFSPGVIAMSATPDPWMVAEILVHESTHHYLHWIGRTGDLDDGSDGQQYFSPFRQKHRPIYFIVVAYHAFANVLLFYRQARAAGFLPPLGAGPFADREATLSAQLAQIEPVLHANMALTPLGQNLWRPLYAQLRR